MTFLERRAAIERLNDRDKRILQLARAVSNNLGFAAQNAHSERIQSKYERAADQAMEDLTDLLISGSPLPPASVDNKP